MPLTEGERNITKAVVDRFLSRKESMPIRPLLIEFQDQDALDTLWRHGVLKPSDDHRQFLPRMLAFHYYDDEVRNRAKASLQLVLGTLKKLFIEEKENTEYTAADIAAAAAKMYGTVNPETISLGLYLAQEFGVLGESRSNPAQTEILSLRIGESIATMKDIDNAWDNNVLRSSAYLEGQRSLTPRQAILRVLYDLVKGQEGPTISSEQYLQAISGIGLFNHDIVQTTMRLLSDGGITTKAGSNAFGLTRKGLNEVEHPARTKTAEPQSPEESSTDTLLVLISHSSKDAALALALIELLRAGLGLRPDQIRCSSVDGYRLPAGVNTDAQLQGEVNIAKVVIGLMTPHSLASPYVLFELGARWGARLPMIPLMVGVKPEDLRGPLSGINALSASVEAQLHQLLEDVRKPLSLALQSAAFYSRYVTAVQEEAERIAPSIVPPQTGEEEFVFEESVRWKVKDGEREGPYCPVCYDDKQKEIHLNPGATKGTYSCGVCRNGFTTNEYNTRPVRRRPFSNR
jgi:hypothetical protein